MSDTDVVRENRLMRAVMGAILEHVNLWETKDGGPARCAFCDCLWNRPHERWCVFLAATRAARGDPVAPSTQRAAHYGRVPFLSLAELKQHNIARSIMRNEIARNRMRPARMFPCVDCGAQARDYDHHMGYEERHALDVEPVCRPCHNKRTLDRLPKEAWGT